MRDHSFGRAGEFHGAGKRDIAGALALADHELANIDDEVLRNIVRQAFDFDGASDDFEQAALHLDAGGLALGGDGNADADALGEIDALEIGVQQRVLDGIDLMVDHHDGGVFAALDGQREDGVVSSGAADDLENLARVDRDRNGILECSVDDGGDLARTARTARFILAARGTHLGGDGNIFSHCISPWRGRSPLGWREERSLTVAAPMAALRKGAVLRCGLPWVRRSAI